MKTYSDFTVSKADLTAIDDKQNTQIRDLKLALIGSFVLNLVVTIALFFMK